MSKLIYNFSTFTYFLLIRLLRFFNAKARLWVVGRRGWRKRYAEDWSTINPNQQPCVWVHCASLGEFEQGRPLIERLKREQPEIKILLTFFSPSGYEIRKNYAQADYVCYLPQDTCRNALIFIEIFKPTLSVFVKYEFWVHFLNTLFEKKIPTLLISAIFREKQVFFQWYGSLFRRLLSGFQCIFTQNQSSADLLYSWGLKNVKVAGDTRIDRVLEIAQEAPAFPLVAAFMQAKNILIVGSSWQPDEAILLPFFNKKLPPDWKVIIAPHDISEPHIQHLIKGLHINFIRYSKLTSENAPVAQVLVIDNIGMLAALYRYGRIAYIGGGFGAGIHNTLEPLAFGLPVIFGPKFQKFEEATQLTQLGGAFPIENQAAFERVFERLLNFDHYQLASSFARQYVHENQGATKVIFAYLQTYFSHTKV